MTVHRQVHLGHFRTIEDDRYQPGAVIPADRWTPLGHNTAEEICQRLGVVTASWAHHICAWPTDDIAELEDHAAELVPLGLDDRFLGVALKTGQLATTSVDQETGLYVGMHLDHWDRQPLQNRPSSRKRLAVNFGPGTRYLLLADTTVHQLASALDVIDVPRIADVRRHLVDGRIECVRIEMQPGDAYFVMTEELVHDGSSLGTAKGSATGHWIGHWGTIPNPRPW